MSNTSPHEILHPKNWKPAKGYSNGMAAQGRQIYLGGQVGWNADQQFETENFSAQVRQTLTNIRDLLQEAGAGPEHLVRLTWFVTDIEEYLSDLREVGNAYRDVLGKNFPAMSLVQVVRLVEEKAKVEIEATAVLPDA